ncbi:hypothetical protein MAHJHV28_47450 [Mycobacterium avium subsp. hominissuis]
MYRIASAQVCGGVPMLPAVATERQVTKQILIYTWLTVLATLALALATGWLYAAVAVVAAVYDGVGASTFDASLASLAPSVNARIRLPNSSASSG